MKARAVPRVSVLIPSYNHAAFVGQAIESALTSEVRDLEVIVVDDASTDGSPDTIRAIADERLRLIVHPKNLGMSAALNTGIAVARSDAIAVLGSDDFRLPGALQAQIDFLDSHPRYDAVLGMPRLVDEAGNPLDIGYREFANPYAGTEPGASHWLRLFFLKGNCLCHPTLVLRRRVHEAIGPYNRRLLNLSDLDLWVRMLVAGLSFFVLPDEVTARRVLDRDRNLSAPTLGTVVRAQFELIQVLKHYRRLPAAILAQMFADEIRAAGISADLTPGRLLAEIASRSEFRPVQFFGLDTLYEELAASPEADPVPLFDLAARVDPFAAAPDKGLPS